jgi:multiple sugar transport system permease protein
VTQGSRQSVGVGSCKAPPDLPASRSWQRTDYLNPLIYLNDQKLYTLQLGLYQYSGEYGREWGLLMAAAVLITLPPIIIFFLTQRTFVQGVTLSGIKG